MFFRGCSRFSKISYEVLAMRRKKFYISQRLRDPSNNVAVPIVIGRFQSRDDRNRAFMDNKLWKKDCFCGISKEE